MHKIDYWKGQRIFICFFCNKVIVVVETLFTNVMNNFSVILLLLLRSLLACNFSLATKVAHRPCIAILSQYRLTLSQRALAENIMKGKGDTNTRSTLPLTSEDLAVNILDTKMNPGATSGYASTGRKQSPEIADDIEAAAILMMMGIDPSSVQSSYEGVGQSEALGGLKTIVTDKKDYRHEVTGTPALYQRRSVRL